MTTTPTPSTTTVPNNVMFAGIGDMLKGYDVINGVWGDATALLLDLFDFSKLPQKPEPLGGPGFTIPECLTFQSLDQYHAEYTSHTSAQSFSRTLGESISAHGAYDGFTGSVDMYCSQTVQNSSAYTYGSEACNVKQASIQYDGTPLQEMRKYLFEDARQAIDGTGPAPMSPETLIGKYGSHILTGAYFGGRFEMISWTLKMNTSESTSMQENMKLTYGIVNGASVSASQDETSKTFQETCNVMSYVKGGEGVGGSMKGVPFLTSQAFQDWVNSCYTKKSVLIAFTDPSTVPLTPIWDLCIDPDRSAAIQAAFANLIGGNVFSDGVDFVQAQEYVRTQEEPGSSHALYQQLCLTVNPNFLDEAAAGNWTQSPQTEYTSPFYVAKSLPTANKSGTATPNLVPVHCTILNGNRDGTAKPAGEGILHYGINPPEDSSDQHQHGVGMPVALPGTTGNIAFYAFETQVPGSQPVYQQALDHKVFVEDQPSMTPYRYSLQKSLPFYHLSDFQITNSSNAKSCIAFFAYPVVGA